jgi:RHS repeat-associated protein
VHVDNLGSVDVLTDEAGAVVERRSYDAFGERRNPAWGSPPILLAGKTSRGFTGHEDDEELGLVNLKGRLYDPHLGRFLSPDPFVSRPHFSQSWNKYSYVLNNPLAFVDPTGFTEDDSHAADPFPGFTMWTPWPGPPLHVTITPGIDEDAAVEGPLEAAEAGASSVPLDVAATGNVAGAVPQPSPVGNVLPRGVSNTIDFILGVHDAADEFAYNAGKTLALNALTFGGYGTYQLGNTLWNGYQEDGVLGALNAVNPAALIKEGWNRTLDQIDKGDYRAAGREGGRTAVIIGSTAISVAAITAAVVNGAVARVAASQAGANTAGANSNVLKVRADQIHSTLDPRAQRARTTAVTEAVGPDGSVTRIVSSSERRLSPVQRQALQAGEIEGIGVGHAEVTGVNAAREMGLMPRATAASRSMCSSCAQFLDQQGIVRASK